MIDIRQPKYKRPLLARAAGVALAAALLYSCASIGRIEGGAYDETPPRFVAGTPMPGALNVKKSKVTIEFDEFIKLDKPGEKIVLSPPQVQQPEVKANGKKVVITLQDTLLADATYTIDFADAIQDNNEGNPLENFSYSFATGSRLDTMVVAGTVLNASNLEPVKGIQVGLHRVTADSAFTTTPFYRVGRTDSRGRFSIRGIAPGSYRLYALQDIDQNYFYSQPSEMIAFADSLVVPRMESRMRQDTTWIDSLTVDTIVAVGYTHYLPDDLLLRCFKEQVRQHRQVRAERQLPHKFTLYFTAPSDSLPLLRGLNFDDSNAFVVEDMTGRRDTLDYWIRDTLLHRQDSLRFSLTYPFTDSLQQVVPRTDTLTVVPKQTWAKLKKQEQEAEEKAKKERERKRKKGEMEQPEVKHLEMETYAPGSMDVYDYVSFSFKEPVERFDTAAIHLQHKVDTLWVEHPYTFSPDSADIKRFNLYADWEPGESYKLTVDSAAVTGLYGLTSDKVAKELKARKLEEYGQIFFNVTGAAPGAFVELLDGSDKPVRMVPLTDGKADFYFLAPGKYGARLVNDTNGNGVWDTGNYAEKRQPETVHYYFQVIELKANFDLTQDWDVTSLAPDKQKPTELKKQKPDEKEERQKQKPQRLKQQLEAAATADVAMVTNPRGDRGTSRLRGYTLYIIGALLMLCAAQPAGAQCAAENKAFKSGEQVVYDLYFNWKFIWKKVGFASLTTHDTIWQGKPAYRYNLLSTGSKQTDFFFKMRDTLTCYTTHRLEPLYFRKGALEGKRHTIDEAWFSYEGGRSSVKQCRTWISEKRDPQRMEYTAPEGLCVFDMLSILAQARSYRAEDYKVGDKILFPMATGRRVEEQTLIYRGKENVEANNDTTYRCLVFSFVEYNKKGKEEEVITFYISDDDNHLPIRLDMYLNFGSAKAFFKRVHGNKYPLTSAVVED